jgi:beta-glucanase (GH16 family)
VLVALVAAVAPATAAAAPPAQPPTWADEFDGTSLDAARWSHRASGQRHDGVLTPDAVTVGGGLLTITTYTEAGQHRSGMIASVAPGSGGLLQAYGYFEARIRFHGAPGQWSAFWLQSPTIGDPIGDPATAGVEMDIAEHRVRCVTAPAPPPTPCGPAGDVSNRIQQALIWDGYGLESKSSVKLSEPLPGLGNDSWHTYALRWTPDQLTFYYDDAPTWTMTGPISRRSEAVILSSEVGAFFAGAIPAGGYGPRETSTTNMQVDYVRAWSFAPLNTAAPVASGTPEVGRALGCSPGSWTGDPAPTFAYEWLSDGAPIAGATGTAYTVQSADQGHTLSCRVTATNTVGTATALSDVLAIGLPPPPASPAPPSRPLVGSGPAALATADRSPPFARLSGSTSQPLQRTLRITISCVDEPCRAIATGTVHVPPTGRARGRTMTLRAPAATIARGAEATVGLTFSSGARAAIRRALRARRRVTVKLAVEVSDSAGNVRPLTRRIALRLPRRA